MKIMVTDERGYIGSVLVPILKEKGYKVVGYDSEIFKLMEHL
jgi:nucleoside-diphosphate-sugar epimerase